MNCDSPNCPHCALKRDELRADLNTQADRYAQQHQYPIREVYHPKVATFMAVTTIYAFLWLVWEVGKAIAHQSGILQ